MKTATVYICDGCGQRDGDQAVLAEHEKSCLEIKAVKDAWDLKCKIAGEEFLQSITTPEQIVSSVISFIKERNNLDIKIVSKYLHFSKCASNTHSAPRGKSTNFNKDPKLPKGYPGWTSCWHIGMSKETYKVIGNHVLGNLFSDYGFYCFSDTKNKFIPIPCIYFGTGGSGSYEGYFEAEEYLQYGITFWAEDFPNINFKKLVTLKQLRDEDISEYESTF